MKHRLTAVIIVVMAVFLSCGSREKQSNTIISKTFVDEQWGRFDYLVSSFKVVEPEYRCDLVLDMTVTDDFPNMYRHSDDDSFEINMTITAPDGSKRSRNYSFRLKDDDGIWKSVKIGDVYPFELPLISDFVFFEQGEYLFKVENKYTRDPLQGIRTLKINCVNKK